MDAEGIKIKISLFARVWSLSDRSLAGNDCEVHSRIRESRKEHRNCDGQDVEAITEWPEKTRNEDAAYLPRTFDPKLDQVV